MAGGTGNDVLNGFWGDGPLQGGWGFDKLTGGAGKDTFHFESALGSCSTTGVDAIMNFWL